MKTCISAVALISLISSVEAGVGPQISVGVSNHGVEPALKWKTSGSAAGLFEYEGGVDATVETSKTEAHEASILGKITGRDEDVPSKVEAALPYVVWGKIKRSVGDFDLTAKGSVKSTQLENINLDVNVDGPIGSLQITGKAGESIAVKGIQYKKAFGALGGKLSLNPRYSVAGNSPDVGVGYTAGGTSVGIDTAGSTKLTVRQRLGENNVVAPTVSTSGDWSLAYTRQMTDSGALTTTYKPNTSLKLEYKDGPWVGSLVSPVDGYVNFGKMGVTLKRSVDIF